ncbi:hypothetical protein NO2_0280 [Candidatus Termititenax persephonae]|uniref:Phage tail fiber protein n=1 Tax=Candidatus Termititenax persephonae TaxID=2218525 RepID=A0A388TF00_9BACT|nr:hypothetical protein NO2_0280 [Candidatus Termititenax persephonae]
MANANKYTKYVDGTNSTEDTDFINGIYVNENGENVAYDIYSEKKISAEGMRNALHTKEKVENKQIYDTSKTSDHADNTLNGDSLNDYYPSSTLVGANLDRKQDTLTFDSTPTADSGNPVTSGGIYTALSGKEATIAMGTNAKYWRGDKTWQVLSDSHTHDTQYYTKNDVNTKLSAKQDKITATDPANLLTAPATAGGQPGTQAVATLQSALPIGTILIYDGTGWTDDSTLKGWYQCNGKNGTPDLRDKFIMGGRSGENMARGGTGGADSRSITLQTANLPAHNHGATGLSISGLSFTDGVAASDGAHEHDLSGGAALAGNHEHSTTGSTILAGGHSHGIIEPNSGSGHRHELGHMDSTGGNPETVYESGGLLKDASYKTNTYYSTTGITIDHDGAHEHSTSGTAASDGAHIHDFTSTSKASSAGAHTHSVTGTVSGGTVGGSTAATGSGTVFTVATVPSYYTVIYIMRVN